MTYLAYVVVVTGFYTGCTGQVFKEEGNGYYRVSLRCTNPHDRSVMFKIDSVQERHMILKQEDKK